MLSGDKFRKRLGISSNFLEEVLKQGVNLDCYKLNKVKIDDMNLALIDSIKDENVKRDIKLSILFATFFGEVVFRNDHFLGRIKINDSNYHISVMRKTDELLKETIIFKTFFNENQKNSIRREIVCEKLLEGSVFLEKEYEEVFGSDFLLEQCEKCYDSRDKLISDISKKKEHHVYDEYNTKEVCFEKNQSVFNKGNVSLKCDNESKLVAVPYLGDCNYDETMSYYIKDSTKDLGYKKITGEEYYKLVGDFKVRSK